MINEIFCVLNEDKSLNITKNATVNQGENLSTRIKIQVPQPAGFLYVLEFETPSKRQFMTPPLEVMQDEMHGSVLYYDISNSLTMEEGMVTMQLAARSEQNFDVVFKSQKDGTTGFFVMASVGFMPLTYQKEDFISEMLKKMQELTELKKEVENRMQDIEKAVATATSSVNSIMQQKQDRPLIFTDIVVPAHSIDDNTGFLQDVSQNGSALFTRFPYRAKVQLSGVDESWRPEVIFGANEASSGTFSSIAISFNSGVYLYSTIPNQNPVNVLKIILTKEV